MSSIVKSKCQLIIAAVALAVLSAVATTYAASSLFGTAACLALLFGVALLALHKVRRRLWAIEAAISSTSRSHAIALACELHSMAVLLSRFPQCTIPTTSWSMRFANLHALVDVMDEIQPTRIVEFGSGISTLCVGAWLAEQGRGGQLMTFDHDDRWADVTRRVLSQHSLNRVAKVFTVPLLKKPSGPFRTEWYDIGDYLSILDDVDLVIVDGPPAGTADHRLSRLPALPAIVEKLARNATVVLDDADRSGEKEVVREWVARFPDFQARLSSGFTGIAILRREARSSADVVVTGTQLTQASANV